MAEPFIGEIKMFGFQFAPREWATCEGQLMSVAQNQTLFSLLGGAYGGDSINQFGLPDLRGRLPMGQGSGPALTPRKIGEKPGLEYTGDVPAHSHTMSASTATTGLSQVPADGWVPAAGAAAVDRNTYPVNLYAAGGGTVKTSTSTNGVPGVSLINPAQVLNFCIALTGLYPSRN